MPLLENVNYRDFLNLQESFDLYLRGYKVTFELTRINISILMQAI